MSNLGYYGKLTKQPYQCSYDELYGTSYNEKDDEKREDKVWSTTGKPKNRISFVQVNSGLKSHTQPSDFAK